MNFDDGQKMQVGMLRVQKIIFLTCLGIIVFSLKVYLWIEICFI